MKIHLISTTISQKDRIIKKQDKIFEIQQKTLGFVLLSLKKLRLALESYASTSQHAYYRVLSLSFRLEKLAFSAVSEISLRRTIIPDTHKKIPIKYGTV